ncbi:MAG: hypothetical protein ACRCV9_19215 [Burkholderiaceae bacterium]
MSTENGTATLEGVKPEATTQTAEIVEQQTGDETATAEESGEVQKTKDPESALKRRISRLSEQRREQAERIAALEAQIQQASAQNSDEDDDGDEEIDVEELATKKASLMVNADYAAKQTKELLSAGSKIEGFDAAAADLDAEITLTRKVGGFVMPTPFMQAILDSDKSAQLVKYLGENIDEALDLQKLSPSQLGRRLGKLEDRLLMESKAKPDLPQKPLDAPGKGGASGAQDGFEKLVERARAGFRG